MATPLLRFKTFGDPQNGPESSIVIHRYHDNLEICATPDGSTATVRVLTSIADEAALYHLLQARHDARVMADIKSSSFPRYLSSDEVGVVLRSDLREEDTNDHGAGLATNDDVEGCVVYDPGLCVSSYDELQPSESWSFLTVGDGNARCLMVGKFDRWQPPAATLPTQEEQHDRAQDIPAELPALTMALVQAIKPELLQSVIDAMQTVVDGRKARGDRHAN